MSFTATAIAEFLTKVERKKCENTQNISLDECYLLFEEYLRGKAFVYILKPAKV